MPYIKPKKRAALEDAINEVYQLINSKGELNYVICELVGQLISESTLSYEKISNWISAVHDAELELRNRILNEYEDQKMDENGDVPSFKAILDSFLME